MILFPAVDIKDGQCVRLKQGRADAVTIFSPDPAAMALHWVEKGAQWLHVVDLDGAFSGMPVNFELIRDICRKAKIPVQLGGGIRDLDTARNYIEAGVRRIIIGTMALEEPELFEQVCAALPGQVGVSLDAVEGRLKTRGWVGDAGATVDQIVPGLEKRGAAFIVYTDIARDGMQSGVNIRALRDLMGMTALPVVAAGGVSTLEDLKALAPLGPEGLEGVITGRAIYVGSLDFENALVWLEANT
ncbi:MAG: 1-(5-phosphoribosyl)-5-[(5-phosphoribosylamino)methylideneamino]imidazole-4-carboxamide isomerase [Desulfovibrionales bacterium]